MVNFSLLLSYKGLPKSWGSSDEADLSSAVQMKLSKACTAIKERQRGGIVYVQGDPAIILSRLWEEGTLDNFVGLSFPEFFTTRMDNDTESLTLKPHRYTFIYDIGNEAAVNKTFAGQLLKQLIVSCKNEKVWCFVCGADTKTKFERDYGIEIQNSITLPNKTEPKLF